MTIYEAQQASLLIQKVEYALDDQRRALLDLKEAVEQYQAWLQEQIREAQKESSNYER